MIHTTSSTPPAADRPTLAPPGTRQKIATLAARAEAGQPLWHAADAADFDGSGLSLQPAYGAPRRRIAHHCGKKVARQDAKNAKEKKR